jgi:hypothetical protein
MFASNTGTSPTNSKLAKDFEQAGVAVIVVLDAHFNFWHLSLAPGFSRVIPVIKRIKPVSTGFLAPRSR